jgi:hypothetical protein
MLVRPALLTVGLLAAGTASAEPMTPDQAKRFVVGKHFTYTCFDGTRGSGTFNGDGSVVGTIQSRGNGPVRYAMLPPGTLRVKGQYVCASLRSLPFEPCFNLDKTDAQTFRGSVWGMGFAYCDFTRRRGRPVVARSTWRPAGSAPPTASASPSASAPPPAR